MFNFLKHTTVEPSLFIYIIVYELLRGLDTNLFLQKKCRFNTTIEPDLRTKCDDEKAGILFISQVNATYIFISLFLSTIVTIFASCWSDAAGRRRRPLIYMAILGQIFHALSGCVNSLFWRWSPMNAVIPWAIFESVSGGILLIVFSCYVYVCGSCDAENRTMRLGLLGAVRLIGVILGKGGFGHILRIFGFYHSYLICFALSSMGLILSVVFIKDTSVLVEKKIGFCQVFNPKRIILDSFKVVFNKNLARKRITVAMLLVVNVAVMFTFYGELSVTYQYLRYRFGWDEKKYSEYLFYRFSVSSLGILFCTSVLSRRFKIHDGLIGILAGIFDTIAIVGLLFATQIWQIYCIPLIDLFHGTATVVCWSFTSKYYNPNEMGRLFAVNGVFALIIPFSFPAYNTIYQKTLDSYPSAFCLLSAVLDVIIVLCYCGAYFCSKKFDKEKPTGDKEETRSMITPM